ncbi:MAG: hypothetical protein WC450_12535 [Candidatus Omnitrophota bacterium]|jgi:hypothetical protein
MKTTILKSMRFEIGLDEYCPHMNFLGFLILLSLYEIIVAAFIAPFGWKLYYLFIFAVTLAIALGKRVFVHIDLWLRLQEVPKTIKNNAQSFYKNGWQEAAVECHEVHIPGDCPLCGAS